jgi:hypothetical protein
MNVKDLHNACGFIADGISYGDLCGRIAKIPGVVFTDRRSFFLGRDDIHAEFSFQGHVFKIEPDPWDSSFWVTPKDAEASYPEISEIRHRVAYEHAA